MENEIKRLLAEYRDIVNKLKEIGVIRTGKVVSDYGEYFASKRLKLTLMSNPVNKGYDAIDESGKKYEIKARKANAWNKPSVFSVKDEQIRASDFIIYVGFDDDWNVVKFLRIPSIDLKNRTSNKMSITKELVNKYSIL